MAAAKILAQAGPDRRPDVQSGAFRIQSAEFAFTYLASVWNGAAVGGGGGK